MCKQYIAGKLPLAERSELVSRCEAELAKLAAEGLPSGWQFKRRFRDVRGELHSLCKLEEDPMVSALYEYEEKFFETLAQGEFRKYRYLDFASLIPVKPFYLDPSKF